LEDPVLATGTGACLNREALLLCGSDTAFTLERDEVQLYDFVSSDHLHSAVDERESDKFKHTLSHPNVIILLLGVYCQIVVFRPFRAKKQIIHVA